MTFTTAPLANKVVDTAQQINVLHESLLSQLRQSVETVVEIGKLLTEKKTELPHGAFGTWIKDNLIFTDRTARNYIKLFQNKDKVLQAGSIAEAYKMLEAPKTETVSDLDNEKAAYLNEVLTKMLPGEVVTGVTRSGSDKVAIINIRKSDETYSKYELIHHYDNGGHVDLNDRGVATKFIPSFFVRNKEIDFEKIFWKYPGMDPVYI
jgi:hypothetical protein